MPPLKGLAEPGDGLCTCNPAYPVPARYSQHQRLHSVKVTFTATDHGHGLGMGDGDFSVHISQILLLNVDPHINDQTYIETWQLQANPMIIYKVAFTNNRRALT